MFVVMSDNGKKRVREVVDFLSYEELQKLKRDLENGGLHLLKLINQQVKLEEETHKVFCAYCGNMLNPNSINNFTLVFGPHDFRKKASFDGIDCLQSFLSNMENLRKKDEAKLETFDIDN